MSDGDVGALVGEQVAHLQRLQLLLLLVLLRRLRRSVNALDFEVVDGHVVVVLVQEVPVVVLLLGVDVVGEQVVGRRLTDAAPLHVVEGVECARLGAVRGHRQSQFLEVLARHLRHEV